jgi:D-serine deaminase-like pyridoxal phosphate-dependent protein
LTLGSNGARQSAVKGVACATAEEAAALANAGFDDILLANEVVSRPALALLTAAATSARLTVAVDSRLGIDVAAKAAAAAGSAIGILVDLNVGSGRCGVSADGPEVVTLARLAAANSSLRMKGIMAYTGRANYYSDRRARAAVAREVKEQVERACQRLREASFEVTVVSGGSTGTFDLDQGLTELQLGSYVLIDGRYAAIHVGFRPALFCAATVVSLERGSRAILDCGWKAISGESGLPVTPRGLTARALSAEHLTCELSEDASFHLGQVVLVVPPHLDTAVTLHERLVVVDNGHIEEWPVDLRRTGSRLVAAPQHV